MSSTNIHIQAIKDATVAYYVKKIAIEDALATARGSPDFKTIEATKASELNSARYEMKKEVGIARAKLHGRKV